MRSARTDSSADRRPTWENIDEYLSCFDGRTAINVATLVPNGNVRMEVMGLDPRKPNPHELAKMKQLVREGMEQGAVGVSSGLDYVPSLYADEDELTALCEEITPYGGIYVTHMRGYTPQKAPAALQEVFNIGKRSGCGVHVSHFNCLADQTIPLLDAARAEGVDVTFDLYCYLYGSTIVAMITLPPETLEGGIEATVERLKLPATRKKLEPAFANPRFPIHTMRLASLPSDIDLVCGAHASLSDGTRSSTRRVVLASDSNSWMSSSMVISCLL